MAGIPGSELEHLLNETRAALGAQGAGGAAANADPAGGGPGGDPGRTSGKGHGEAAGGLVRATVSADGEIDGIEIDPRAMRMPSEELGGHVAHAVNAAFQGLGSGAAVPAAADTERLAARARDVQDMSMKQMRQMTRSIADLMAQLHGGRR